MTDRLRPFCYYQPHDHEIVWDCCMCQRATFEGEEPGRYTLDGRPVCMTCEDARVTREQQKEAV